MDEMRLQKNIIVKHERYFQIVNLSGYVIANDEVVLHFGRENKLRQVMNEQ